jgi:hypothetical protein
MPRALAVRVRCAAHSRTCATDPGAEVSASEYSVWIESMTQNAGASTSSVAMMRSNWISAITRTREPSSPKRRARSATCAPLSSPLTYKTFICFDSVSAACKSSVLLPMPGSPPISVTPPGTMPPPSTRSNSSWPVGVRSTAAASISANVVTGALLASD